MVVSFALLGMMLAGLAAFQRACGKANRLHLLKQQCILAAEAQLESIAVTGRAIDDKDLARCWPGVDVRIEKAPGAGQWAGLSRLTVTARAAAESRNVEVRLCRYLPPAEVP